MNDQYILYVAAECNFQSRTMLIPMDEFLKVRQADYDLLKQHARLEKHGDYTINTLYVHWKRKDNTASQIESPYLKVINELTGYADIMDIYDDETGKFENCYYDMKDQIWYDLAKCRLCGGFDHIENHQYLLEKYPNIVDSFLVLNIED